MNDGDAAVTQWRKFAGQSSQKLKSTRRIQVDSLRLLKRILLSQQFHFIQSFPNCTREKEKQQDAQSAQRGPEHCEHFSVHSESNPSAGCA